MVKRMLVDNHMMNPSNNVMLREDKSPIQADSAPSGNGTRVGEVPVSPSQDLKPDSYVVTQTCPLIERDKYVKAGSNRFDVRISEDHKRNLKRCRKLIVEDLVYKFISDALFECDVLEEEVRQQLEISKKTEVERVRELLDYIARRTEKAYYSFAWALMTDYHWLYEACKSLCHYITI